ncbi:MAG: HAMP domain-containing sensor histidine kinase [Patescibacteria group bacterium]
MDSQSLLFQATAFFFGFLAIIIILIESHKREKHKLTAKKTLADLKEDFTNMIVHELRAPLISIKDSSELIISDKYNLDEKEKKQFLEIINQQSKLLLDQVGSILDSAKLGSGKFTLTRIQDDLGKIIKEQIKIFLPQATKKHISLTSSIPSSLPKISIDSIRIGQVMNNLLSNSIKFTQEGGTLQVVIYYNPNKNKFITVSVTDTGIGIPKEFQKDLFSKFAQANDTPQKLAKQGTGLGLYVVKGIVEAHGGTVSLESTPAKGTTISFTLPVILQPN